MTKGEKVPERKHSLFFLNNNSRKYLNLQIKKDNGFLAKINEKTHIWRHNLTDCLKLKINGKMYKFENGD